MRRSLALLLLLCSVPVLAFAQAPATPPLVLHLPTSARTAALGNAWVAGRDAEVLFYNPAQLIGSRSEIAVSVLRPGNAGTSVSAASAYAAGRWSLTLGWGVHALGFNVDPAAPYPYSPDVLSTRGTAHGQSLLLGFGGAVAYKGLRMGGAVKYLSDGAATPLTDPIPVSMSQHAWVADVGVARSMWGGVFAFSAQNLGSTRTDDESRLITPQQYLAGWSMGRSVGPLDLTGYAQLTMRPDWIAPAGGLDIGYSWIEGYNISARIGARRPEAGTGNPMSFGGAITADRLTVEYAVQLNDGGRASQGVTVRWR
jgi:hypothetical protein